MRDLLPATSEQNNSPAPGLNQTVHDSHINEKVIKGLTLIASLLLDVAIVIIRKPFAEQKSIRYKFSHIIRLINTLTRNLESTSDLLQDLTKYQKTQLILMLERLIKVLSS